MEAEIKAGKNWQLFKAGNIFIPANGCIVPSSRKAGFENQTLGTFVQVCVFDAKVQIPAPMGIAPSDADGEGVTVSQLKDEEGYPSQEFLNLSEGTWLSFFPSDDDNHLTIVAKK